MQAHRPRIPSVVRWREAVPHPRGPLVSAGVAPNLRGHRCPRSDQSPALSAKRHYKCFIWSQLALAPGDSIGRTALHKALPNRRRCTTSLLWLWPALGHKAAWQLSSFSASFAGSPSRQLSPGELFAASCELSKCVQGLYSRAYHFANLCKSAY